MSPSSLRRTDIDLLRAFAVLVVILFHFEVPGFDGGFLGVDIFFVISGYLITAHIREQLSSGTFTFSQFYARRIRRLMPALVAIFVITSITSLLVFPRDLLLDFAHSQLASALYVSNIYFWSVADYFDTSSYLKPLLHTWSLSVEEQFYLFWPLCLFFVGVRHSRWFILVAGVLSLIAAEIVYEVSATAAFFMFPFRIFEFAIGAWISVANIKKVSASQGYSLLGIAILMLLGSIFLHDERSRMPGILSLPVCVATALIISINHPWLNRQDFFTKIFLRIGLISYSAYLVHWPLVVFYKFLVVYELRWIDSLVLLITTLLLAELLYRLIELPFGRFRLAGKQRYYFGSLVLLIAIAWFYIWFAAQIYDLRRDQNLTVSAVIDNTPRRSPELWSATMRGVDQELMSKAPIQILVVGDSHSIDATLALVTNLDVSHIGVKILHNICDPLTLSSIGGDFDKLYHDHVNPSLDRDECMVYNRGFAEIIAKKNPDILIFSEDWREQALPYFAKTLEEIKAIFPGKILVLGPNFSFRQEPLLWMKRNVKLISQLNEQAREIELDQSHINSELSAIAEQSNVLFISKIDLVCPQENCDFLLEDQLSYSDTSHWTLEGSKFFGARLVEHDVFKKLIAEVKQGSPPVLDPATEGDPDSPPADISVEIAGICNIESIGGVGGPALDSPVQVESDTMVGGWRTYRTADGTEAPAWLRVLGQDGGVVFQTPLAATVERPGVAKLANRESALLSEFSQVKVTALQQGSYTLEVVLDAGPQWVRCSHTRQIQVM